MEMFSTPWWSALLAIILIDLVLAGDNAIVIALAARSLPPALQKKAIVWGTLGAIVVRSAMTVGVVWLLQIPGLMLAGGLGLLWIAYKLLADNGEDEHAGPVAHTFWGAMKTIVKLGAAVLAFTAARMIVGEPLLDAVFDPPEFVHTAARWTTYAAAVAGVLGAGWWSATRRNAPVQLARDHGHAA